MSSSGKKEYYLKINGLTQGITEATKLEEVLAKLDGTVGKTSATASTSAKASKTTATAVDEEKRAQKQLEQTLEKTRKVRSKATDEQLLATQQLREATREATRRVQINELEEGSVKRLGMELNDLRNKYYELSDADRQNVEVGGQMLTQIQDMDGQYKAAKESAGQFQESVGNYGRATEGLGKLATGIEGVNKTTMGLAQGLMGSTVLLGMFGEQSSDDTKRIQELQKVIMLLSIAGRVNTNVIKEGIVQNKLSAVTDGIKTIQTKAKTAAEAAGTKGTVMATAAQKMFNLVAMANPYVLLAMALVGVVAALVIFSTSTEDAAEKQNRLNAEQSLQLDILDRQDKKIREDSDAKITEMERQIKVLSAQGDKQKEIRALEDKIAAERQSRNATLSNNRKNELRDLDKNKAKLEELQKELDRVQRIKDRGAAKVKIEVDGKIKKVDIEKAIESLQGQIDNTGKKVEVAVALNTEKSNDDADAKALAAARLKEDQDKAKARAKVELDALRAAGDARMRLIKDDNERAQQQMAAQYNRQINDLKLRFKEEKGLTVTARKAINATILRLMQERNTELAKLERDQQRAQAAVELDLLRQIEDGKTSLITGEFDRRTAEINAKYDRQIEDLRIRLEQDETLTLEAKQRLTDLIIGAEEAREKAITNLRLAEIDKRASLERGKIDDWLAGTEQQIGKVIVRSKTGLELIDVKATRDNLTATNAMLSNYVSQLERHKLTLATAHSESIKQLKEGTPEYEAALLQYAKAVRDVNKEIAEAQDQQVDNTRMSTNLQQGYYAELASKISDGMAAVAEAAGAVTDTIKMALEVQLEELNSQIEEINGKYEEAQRLREDSVARVESLEEDLRNATGGTADAIKEQLADEMHARADAAREEARLAKEKERLEAEIAKKERQMKRTDLSANIISTIASVASSVAKALELGPILGPIMAGVMAATGAVQVGIMVGQLAKLADGGLIGGPSHSMGGARIHGTNIEVEGGEFVINKASASANAPLIEYINSARGPVAFSNVLGAMGVTASPALTTGLPPVAQDKILEAIRSIDLNPVVSVVDIIGTSRGVSEVQDLAGF